IIGGERTILEDRMAEEVCRRHGHLHAGASEGLLEVSDDGISLLCARTERNQIVVMEIHPMSSELGEFFDDARRGDRLAHATSKGIGAWVAYGPKSEGESIFWAGVKLIGHGGRSSRIPGIVSL